MSTQSVVFTDQPRRRFTVFNNPRSEQAAAGGPATALRVLEMGQELHAQLDVQWVVDTFFSLLRNEIPFDNYSFNNSDLPLSYRNGKRARHRISYRVVLGEQTLGELEVTRSRMFANKEVQVFEGLLCALLYPLRNALMYQMALRSAHRDPLTGVANRAALELSVPREIHLAQRHGLPMSLLVLDLDNFKEVNDLHGHATGDDALRRLVDALRHCLRTTDLVFRYGGDEFVVTLSNTDAASARQVAERVRQRLERSALERGSVKIRLSTSIGISEVTKGDTLESLFQRADQAMLQSKRGGRNQVTVS